MGLRAAKGGRWSHSCGCSGPAQWGGDVQNCVQDTQGGPQGSKRQLVGLIHAGAQGLVGAWGSDAMLVVGLEQGLGLRNLRKAPLQLRHTEFSVWLVVPTSHLEKSA